VKAPSNPVTSNNAVAEWPVDQRWDPWAYWTDACQRSILFWDVLRQRGEGYQEHTAKAAPHVLKFRHELVVDGRGLPRPVNYGLVRVQPPDGVEIDAHKRPFVIVQASVASRRIAKSVPSSRQGMPATSLDSCPIPFLGRQLRTSLTQRPHSWNG
jgi:hypothetical protein